MRSRRLLLLLPGLGLNRSTEGRLRYQTAFWDQTDFDERIGPFSQLRIVVAENPTFQALSSELRTTEFQVILRASQFAKCISKS
jgi:hypothetical protein